MGQDVVDEEPPPPPMFESLLVESLLWKELERSSYALVSGLTASYDIIYVAIEYA